MKIIRRAMGAMVLMMQHTT